MTLGIHIGRVRPGEWGYTAVGGWPHEVNDRLGVAAEGTYLLWTLEPHTMRGCNQYGQCVALRPFFGVMGMPPAEPACGWPVPPRPTGGNLDCKELVAGSTLYLPIAVPGGLFSAGDGHARQGDGELQVTAIWSTMEAVDLTFTLHPDMHLTMPRGQYARRLDYLGLHEDLNEAALLALEGMVDLLGTLHGNRTSPGARHGQCAGGPPCNAAGK